MKKEEVIKNIIQYKSDVDKLIHRKYHELAQNYNLSLEQFHLLIELDELMLDVYDGGSAPTVGEIAKNINNSQNTVSERISRLEAKGLVERVKDSNDKRISRIFLTGAGKKLMESIENEANSSFFHDSLDSLEDKDLDNFKSCFEKLIFEMQKRF